MGDCFPKTTSGAYERRFPTSDACKLKTGASEYKAEYKKWPGVDISVSQAPDSGLSMADLLNSATGCGDVMINKNKPRYSFSKGPRFGISPYCDCTPPPERFRFSTTYQADYVGKLNKLNCNMPVSALPGVKERCPIILPPQQLCPFTTESTYSRAFDMTQPYYKDVCAQQEGCGGSCQPPCEPPDACSNPVQGITIQYLNQAPRRQVPPLYKDDLVKPGTDTTDCPRCPREIPCCPCEDSSRLCDACCSCEYPGKLHQATTTPTRKYPIVMGTPRYVPDPRVPPRRPKLLCHGGTLECPLQKSFPTGAAINQAKQRLIEKLEEERCVFPPECIESTYRASFKTPPLQDTPIYCSKEDMQEVYRANAAVACKGLPPPGYPMYCLDGGRPPDPRPRFDHFSTYEADLLWTMKPRFRLLGGEIPCNIEQKPMCCPCIDARQVIKSRTEEKERWGEDWECNPQPA